MQPRGWLDLTLVDLIPARPLWMRSGVCREHPEVTWFPAKGQPTAPAKALPGPGALSGLRHGRPDPDRRLGRDLGEGAAGAAGE